MDNLRSLTLFICLGFLLSVVGIKIEIGAGEKKNLQGHFSFAPHIYIGLVQFIYLYIRTKPDLFLPSLLTGKTKSSNFAVEMRTKSCSLKI